jgi:hypothetical protein
LRKRERLGLEDDSIESQLFHHILKRIPVSRLAQRQLEIKAEMKPLQSRALRAQQNHRRTMQSRSTPSAATSGALPRQRLRAKVSFRALFRRVRHKE